MEHPCLKPTYPLDGPALYRFMSRTVVHNIDAVAQKLSFIDQRHIPYAARTTVKRLGFKLARKDIPGYMKAQFRKPVPFTTGSVFYNAISDYEVEISINRDKETKKNDPKFYLNPTIPGQSNKAYDTRFTKFLHRGNIVPRDVRPVPIKGNPGMKLNAFGNVRPSEYSRIVSGLKKPRNEKTRNFRYVSVPDLRTPRPPRKGSLFDTIGEGIYRIKGSNKNLTLQKLMSYTRQPISAKNQSFNYYKFVEDYTHAFVPREFGRHLAHALRTARF